MSQTPNANDAPVDAALPHLEAGFLVGNGRFTLIRMLGRGGMGVVWLARDESLREDVALKFLPPEIRFDAVALDDLRRETARARKLTHPNIIRIHDLYKDDREAFISMEYVDGPNLGDLRLGREPQVFAWDYLRPLVQQLCAALDYAHSERVVHRDLKPANLMLDARGRLKLSDFGIAAQVSDSVSRVSMVRHGQSGTITYMSPQQMDGKLPQITDDIYALGATLYELLTGRPPFFTGDIGYQVRNLPPQPMHERMAELDVENPVPPAIAALVMACLRKEPEQRPASAGAVAEWIEMRPPTPAPAPVVVAPVEVASIRATPPATSRPRPTAPVLPPPVEPTTDTFAPQPEVEQPAPEEPVLMAEFETAAAPAPAAPERRSNSRGTLLFVTGALVITLLSALVLAKLVRDSRRRGREAARSVSSEATPAHNAAGVGSTISSPAAGKWTTIFNGTSLDAWRGWDAKSWIGSWSILDQNLQSLPGGKVHLATREQYGDFELEFEWKVAAGANSGILYRALPGPGDIWDTAPEYQIMDDALDRGGRVSKTATGALYGLVAPNGKSLRPTGEFNSGRIVMRGSEVEHWLNGVKVLEADLARPDTRRGMPPQFDPEKWGLAPRGHIVLQHYGGETGFRNIRVRKLTEGATRNTGALPATTSAGIQINIFDGQTQKTWRGDRVAWNLSGGTIIGSYASSASVRRATGLFLERETLRDFELELEFKTIRGQPEVRFHVQEGADFFPAGYLCQLAGNVGSFSRVQTNGTTGGLTFPGLELTAEAGAARAARVKKDDWNRLRIVVRQNRFRSEVNGEVFLQPWDQENLFPSGKLALTLQPGAAAEFRNIRLRHLAAE